MTIYTYNPNIPAKNDAPANDQPIMQTNAASLAGIIGVDHVGFVGDKTNGQHMQVTFNTMNPQGTPTGTTSILYTGAGAANAAQPQLFWVSAAAIYHFPIKAWGMVTSGATGKPTQSWNVNNITGSGGVYTVTLTMGAVQSAAFGIIATTDQSGGQTVIDATVTGFAGGVGTFRVNITTTGGAATNSGWSFQVMQL